MAKISRDILREFVEEGFFDNSKSINDVVEKFDMRGFPINPKKRGLVAQLLAFLCREGLLEREKDPEGNWRYKKR